MFCGNCGRNIPDGVAFCPGCGTPMAATAQENQQKKASVFCPGCGQMVTAGTAVCSCCGTALAPTYKKEKNCPGCGMVMPEDAQICGNCGAVAYKARDGKKTGWFKKYWWIAAIGVAVVAFLIVGFLTNWFTGKGAADAIWDGAQKTVLNENFTADITISADGHTESATLKGSIDEDEEKVTLYGVDGNGNVMAVHEGYAIQGRGSRTYAEDISYALSNFFEIYNMLEGGLDVQELMTQYMGGDQRYEMISQYVDVDALQKFADEVWDCFNDTAWLEENAGFSKDGNTYTLHPDLYKLARAVLEQAKDIFPNEYAYEEMMESLDDMQYELDYVDVKVQYTVESGKLTKVVVIFDVDGEKGRVSIDFYDIGSTEIDMGALDELLEEATW